LYVTVNFLGKWFPAGGEDWKKIARTPMDVTSKFHRGWYGPGNCRSA